MVPHHDVVTTNTSCICRSDDGEPFLRSECKELLGSLGWRDVSWALEGANELLDAAAAFRLAHERRR
jgi:hypothetical protein